MRQEPPTNPVLTPWLLSGGGWGEAGCTRAVGGVMVGGLGALELPFLSQCSIVTMTRAGEETRSIAPPIPATCQGGGEWEGDL